MPSSLVYGETATVLMELGFPVNPFTLNSATLGVLDEDYLDGTLIGDDVSPYVYSVGISRGRSSQLDEFGAGRCTIVLNNNDRRFDPTNQSSPYWDTTLGRSGVTPRRKVTVIVNSTTVFVGRIADIDLNYDFANKSTVTISVVDDFVLLANAYTGAALTPTSELSGARMTYILNQPEIDYPATRSISTGIATLGAYQIDANSNALTYVQQIAQAESGLCFISRDGILTFSDRVAAAFATVAAYFTDTGANIPYQTLSVVYGQELLYNRVQVTRVSGTVQEVDNLTSQAEYGISTYAIDNVLLATDSDALALANNLLTLYANPEYRFDAMTVMVSNLSVANRNIVNALDIGQVISITRSYSTGTPASVTALYAIERINHTILPSLHSVEFGLRQTDLLFQFILNDATYGVLDSTNALA
jgi:hypothetical protein